MVQSTQIGPVKAELKKKSQVNTKSQVQTSKSKREYKPEIKLDL